MNPTTAKLTLGAICAVREKRDVVGSMALLEVRYTDYRPVR